MRWIRMQGKDGSLEMCVLLVGTRSAAFIRLVGRYLMLSFVSSCFFPRKISLAFGLLLPRGPFAKGKREKTQAKAKRRTKAPGSGEARLQDHLVLKGADAQGGGAKAREMHDARWVWVWGAYGGLI